MVGYCSTGSALMERAPASMRSSAMTIAKIGRSMKNLAMARLLRLSGLDRRLDGAHGHRAGGLIDRDVGELKLADEGVPGAVFQGERHLGLIGAVQLQLPARRIAAQLQAGNARLGEIDVDRIDLLHGREKRRGACL